MAICCTRCRETYGEEHNAPCEARQRSESEASKRQKVDDYSWIRRGWIRRGGEGDGGAAAEAAVARDEEMPQAEADRHAPYTPQQLRGRVLLKTKTRSVARLERVR